MVQVEARKGHAASTCLTSQVNHPQQVEAGVVAEESITY